MTDIDAARLAEHAKYARAYEAPRYHMKKQRRRDAISDLAALPIRGSYLDVSCGRGEMLIQAEALGFSPVRGTEIVSALLDPPRIVYAEAHALPFSDKSFDVATMLDVIEHLIPGDDRLACLELARIARQHIIITANNRPSHNHAGDDLHINKRPYDEWHGRFKKWFRPHRVTWIKAERHCRSEAWRIDL